MAAALFKQARRFAVAAFVLATFALAAQPATAPVRASEQLVVTANPHASEAGRAILRAGGGAVDAAIAVQLVLTLVEPQSSGIGGGAFMLVYAADGDAGAITAYEGRETAPAAATPDMFLNANGRPESFANVGVGGLAVGVPGALRMLELAHREHGRLPWSELFAPAIALAENGFAVSPRLNGLLNGFRRFARGDDFRRYFFDENGAPHPVGFVLKNPEYAATLKLLAAAGGAEPMHTGGIAAAIAAEVADNNVRAGRMTQQDLASYRANVTPPLCTPYRAWRVCGPQLPSSGGVTTQQVLGLLAHFELPDIRAEPVRAIHLFAEANRLAFADRNLYLGDPSFVAAPVGALLDPRYLRSRAALIDPARAMSSVSPGEPLPAAAWRYAPGVASERPSTSHFSIVDRFGDAVAMTTSVQGAFGSQLMVGGFILNNQLTDFDYVPTIDGQPVANRVEGGKRPLSSMAPTMLLDERGRLRFVVGSPGGTRIIGFVAQSIVSIVDWGLDAQQAVAAPHFLAEEGPIEIEEGTPAAAHQQALEAMGHRVVANDMNSGLHAIAIDYSRRGRALYGGVDPRREGVALAD